MTTEREIMLLKIELSERDGTIAELREIVKVLQDKVKELMAEIEK